ncbi:MAG: sigma-70 family RNA polymerase sigma factor [Chryseolinea sp.]
METLIATPGLTTGRSNVPIEEFYRHSYPIVARFVAGMKGTDDDAKDIFQDAVIIYLEKNDQALLEPIKDQERYLLGIAKHLWLKKFSKSRHMIKLDEFESLLNIPEDFYPSIRTSLLLQFLESTGRKCLELLSDFYYRKLSMKSIADAYGFSTERSATVQKYKCIEKLREEVKNKSLLYEDFFE